MAVDTKGGGITGFVRKFWDEIIGGFILYKTGQAAGGGGQGQASGGSWLSNFLLTLFPSLTDEDERLWARLTTHLGRGEQPKIFKFVTLIGQGGFDEDVFRLRLVKNYKEELEKKQGNSSKKILRRIAELDGTLDTQIDFCLGKKLLVRKGVFKKAFRWSKGNKFVTACYGVTAIILFGYVFSVVLE